MCECRPGFRYPEYIQGPYLGVAIERATEEEYNAGFHCIESQGMALHVLLLRVGHFSKLGFTVRLLNVVL